MSLPLIDKFDNSEIIRDRIAALLIVEITRQRQLALAAVAADAAHYNDRSLSFGTSPGFVAGPDDWNIPIYVEREKPWDATKPEAGQRRPIVNVWFENATLDAGESNVIEKQAYNGTYNIDCYGFGKSEQRGADAHVAGDQRAVYEVHRTARQIRNILMASPNVYLGYRKDADGRIVVKGRMVTDITLFKPELDGQPVENAHGARVVLRVEFNEYSPQYVVEELDGVDLNVIHGQSDRTESLSYG